MSRTCAPTWRRFAMACRLPVWKSHGPGPFVILVWTPLLLADPILSVPAAGPAWSGWLWLAAVAAADAAAVLAAYRENADPRLVVSLLAAQTLVSIGATWWYGAQWGVLFTLLGLTYGAVGSPKWAPRAIAALTIGGGLIVWWQGGTWTNMWVTSLTTFLAGMSTYGFHRLLSVIAELDATRQELARQAVDQERLRFARDLHDLLGHTLSVIVVKSEVIRRLPPGDSAAAAQHAKDIEDIGRQALVEVREAVTGYRDTDLHRELHRAKIATEAAGITLRADIPAVSLPTAADTLFGWVVREAVTNVIRHARARTCRIELHTNPADDAPGDARLMRLRVADDGRGGDPAGGGDGIRGLRERASAVGGSLTASNSERGFVLSAELPLRTNGETT